MTRVVVVGGGYGGVTAATALDEVADVVLVEPKDAFQHNVAALRALVQPDLLPQIFLPYSRLLVRGTVVRDRAVAIHDDGVLLASGRRLDAAFVVVATGSTYPFPAKSTLDSVASISRYRALHAELDRASRVTLVGAGPVGIEFAGEIASAWPSKLVTLVDVAPDIMPGPYDRGLRDELRRQLEALSVKLLLGTPSAPDADITFQCHGLIPVSPLSGGYLRVEDDLRVVGYTRVYAIGDVAAGDANRVAVARAGRVRRGQHRRAYQRWCSGRVPTPAAVHRGAAGTIGWCRPARPYRRTHPGRRRVSPQGRRHVRRPLPPTVQRGLTIRRACPRRPWDVVVAIATIPAQDLDVARRVAGHPLRGLGDRPGSRAPTC